MRITRYCKAHAEEHGKDLNQQTAVTYNYPKFEADEGDVERVANYLLKGHMSGHMEISKVLGMKEATVVHALVTLMRKGVVDHIADTPPKFRFKL